MHASEILPWNWGKRNVPVQSVSESESERAVPALQDTVSRVINDFFGGGVFGRDWPIAPHGEFLPPLDASETDECIQISLELPGLDAKDVDVSLADDMLTIKGQKSEESERDDDGTHWTERRFGSFQRVVPLPCEVEPDSATASFKRGVLEIELHKSEVARTRSRGVRIQIQ
jgi:HSP20 family protein